MIKIIYSKDIFFYNRIKCNLLKKEDEKYGAENVLLSV